MVLKTNFLSFFSGRFHTGFTVFSDDGLISVMHENNKGTDKHAYLSSLISIFVIDSLRSIIDKLATCLVSIF